MPALVAAGQTVAANADATQAQINAARDALRTAIAKVRIKPDRSPLLAALNAASPLNFSLYSDETVRTLNALIDEARNLLSRQDEDITQAQIDTLVADIFAAIAGLAEKPVAGAPVVPPATPAAPAIPAIPVAPGAGELAANALGAGSGNVANDGVLNAPGAGSGNVANDGVLNAPASAGDGIADNAIGDGSVIDDNVVPQVAGDGTSASAYSIGYIIGLAALVVIVAFLFRLVLANKRRRDETQ
jgi:hypothetical protein